MELNEQQVIKDYYNLRSCRAVSEKYGCNPETIRRILKRNDIKLTGRKNNGKNQPQKKITDEQLIEACKTMTRQEIADVYGMHIASVDRRTRKLGIHAVRIIQETPGKRRNQYTWGEYVAKRRAQAEERRKEKANLKNLWDFICIIEERTDKECVVCGKTFHSRYQGAKFCSGECRRYWNNNRKDKRIPKEKIIDKDITLKKLFKRDSGKCWICGGNCDWNDTFVNDLSNRRYGPTYPSKDHVIPIARGGFESWDNVRLAHLKCNEEKSANIYPYLPMDKEFAYSYKGHGTPPKKTAQYTLDGQLIKVWPSVASIRRELGLNDKHIQNVCRRDGSNTGNAYGYHWEYLEEA